VHKRILKKSDRKVLLQKGKLCEVCACWDNGWGVELPTDMDVSKIGGGGGALANHDGSPSRSHKWGGARDSTGTLTKREGKKLEDR